MKETWDRFTTSVQVTANATMTREQWEDIHQTIADAIENCILESPRLTDLIGHVHLGSPWDYGIEICI